jgi:hypothetical protein
MLLRPSISSPRWKPELMPPNATEVAERVLREQGEVLDRRTTADREGEVSQVHLVKPETVPPSWRHSARRPDAAAPDVRKNACPRGRSCPRGNGLGSRSRRTGSERAEHATAFQQHGNSHPKTGPRRESRTAWSRCGHGMVQMRTSIPRPRKRAKDSEWNVATDIPSRAKRSRPLSINRT